MPKLDIITGFVPDYMHCGLSGVVRQFTMYFFDRNSPASLDRGTIAKINKLLTDLKAPIQVARLNRDFETQSKFKAKEWENWVLFYSKPCLSIIPEDRKKFFLHWSDLVEAIYILLKDSIKLEELTHADNLCKKFFVTAQRLYGPKVMKYNVHQLWHLCDSVRD